MNTIQTQSPELNSVQHYRVKSLADSFKASLFQAADLHLFSGSWDGKKKKSHQAVRAPAAECSVVASWGEADIPSEIRKIKYKVLCKVSATS